MRIGLDGIPLNQELTGVGHYTHELARALAAEAPGDQFDIVSPLTFIPQLYDSRDGRPPNLRLVRAKANLLTRRWWTIGAPLYVVKNSVTLFHGTNFEVPLWQKCPSVLTIHDLSHFLYPETHEQPRVRRARRRLPLMARTATMIITPTEQVRTEVCKSLKIPRDKVVVVPEAAREKFRPMALEQTASTRTRLRVERDFLLFVGTIEPRKNLLTLLPAFNQILRERSRPLQLVIAGKQGWLTDELFDYIAQSGLTERIRFTGYLGDEDLRALYSSCRIFVYPSVYEGFGLPPLEAMACGAPVIASRIESIAEVCAGAARLVKARDVEALARATIALLDSEAEQQRLSAAGLERVREFSWLSTAQQTREVYTEAMRRFAATAPAQGTLAE